MIRRSTLAAWTLTLLAAGPGCNRIDLSRLGSGPPADAKSVVLVTIDTLRADHVGAYGAEGVATPTLDGLAAEGVRFETAITSTPITLPSHSSIFTGMDPPDHGVRHNGTFKLADEATTRHWVQEAIASTGATQPRDLGRIMGALMKDHKGEIDGALAKRIADELLGG